MNKLFTHVAEISVSYHPAISDKSVILSALDAYNLFIEFFPISTIHLQERFLVMYQNRANRALGIYPISVGGISGTVADVRLILSVGLKIVACSFMLAHNHPSGNLNPGYTLDVTSNTLRAGNFITNAASGSVMGVRGEASSAGDGDRAGVEGIAKNAGHINVGVYGEADGTENVGGRPNIGIYGTASGGTGPESNWGGWFVGDVNTTGIYYAASDRKLKTDIHPISDALFVINRLKPSAYTYKCNEYKQMHLPEGIHYGLIADEVQQVVPGAVKKAVQPAVFENQDETKGKQLSNDLEYGAVNYTEMIPILIGAVKEQQQIIETQKSDINLLKSQVAELTKAVNTLMNK